MFCITFHHCQTWTAIVSDCIFQNLDQKINLGQQNVHPCTVVTHRLGRKNHSLGHHFSRFSPHSVTFLSNQYHFIMPKLKDQKVKVPIFFGLDG